MQATVEVRVPARVGLVGNPSDGFGGAVLAAVVDDWAASVRGRRLQSGLRLRSQHAPPAEWSSPAALAADVDQHGHPAPHRIVTASLHALDRHLTARRGAPLPAAEIEWSSTIPRSVGLAGSSAIAVAVIEAAAGVGGVGLDPRVTAALALEAEVSGLGIPAGWQDRIVQAHRRAVLVDAADRHEVDGRTVPGVRTVPELDLPAVVGWRTADAEDSGAYHADLRRRPDDTVAAAMATLAALARRAADCAALGDRDGLIELVDASWAARKASMPIRPVHERLVESVRAIGVVATSPGSGGSVVALPRDERETGETLAALLAAGAEARLVRLG